MSILIKGMEMPKSCGFCPLRHEARDGDECYLGASLTEYQKRPYDCPIVPIQPHGRLIDADNLLTDKSMSIIGKGMIFGGQYVFSESEIVNAPTIIPAEEGE